MRKLICVTRVPLGLCDFFGQVFEIAPVVCSFKLEDAFPDMGVVVDAPIQELFVRVEAWT